MNTQIIKIEDFKSRLNKKEQKMLNKLNEESMSISIRRNIINKNIELLESLLIKESFYKTDLYSDNVLIISSYKTMLEIEELKKELEELDKMEITSLETYFI